MFFESNNVFLGEGWLNAKPKGQPPMLGGPQKRRSLLTYRIRLCIHVGECSYRDEIHIHAGNQNTTALWWPSRSSSGTWKQFWLIRCIPTPAFILRNNIYTHMGLFFCCAHSLVYAGSGTWPKHTPKSFLEPYPQEKMRKGFSTADLVSLIESLI